MGYTVSVKVKPLNNSTVGRSIAHDFRTSFTVNVRNNRENAVINIVDGSSTNFRANDNLINQDKRYEFHSNGNRISKSHEVNEDIDLGVMDDDEVYDFINDREIERKETAVTDDIFDLNNKVKNIVEDAEKNQQKKSKNLNKNKRGQILFKSIKSQTEKEIENMNKKYKERLGRNIPKNAKYFQEALLFFGADKEEREKREIIESDMKGLTDTEIANINSIDRAEMDKAAAEFFRNLEETTGVKVLYLVRHDDEKTCHYQGIFTNMRMNEGKMLGMDRKKLVEFNQGLQDSVYEYFKNLEFADKSLNIARGEKKLSYAEIKDKTQRQQEEVHDNNIRLINLQNKVNELENILSSKENKLLEVNTSLNSNIDTVFKKQNDLSSLYEQIDIEEAKLVTLKEQITTVKKSKSDILEIKNNFKNRLNNAKDITEKEDIINTYFQKTNEVKFKELDNYDKLVERNSFLEKKHNSISKELEEERSLRIETTKKLKKAELELKNIIKISKAKIDSLTDSVKRLKQNLSQKVKNITILEKYTGITVNEVEEHEKNFITQQIKR